MKKIGNWQIATDTLIALIKATGKTFYGGFEKSFISVQGAK